MQEVYKDGTGGEITSLDGMKDLVTALADALEKDNVDHVEVFQEGSTAHKRAIKRMSDHDARKKARRKLRKIVEKK